MADLLFLAHRIPYPPDKGDKIRSWNVLRHLAERYSVHLGCFVDDPDDRRHEASLRALCADCHFARLGPYASRLKGLGGLLDGAPLTLACYRDRGLAAWVGEVLGARRPAHIVVFSSAMAQYALDDAAERARRVIDFVDVDSDKWRQYAESRGWPARWVFGRESRRLLDFERRVAGLFDASVFVSEAEAALFRRLAPESAAKVTHVDNGVDVAYFSPEHVFTSPFTGQGPAIVFTGAMDYWANVDAVAWFAREVLPLVRRHLAEARFFIVGARPAAEVRRLARLPGVTVTGRVADVRPYLAAAAVVVAPLRVARGIQNKVLEAMAMARPVVVTPQALDGIDAHADREVRLATDPPGLAAAVVGLAAGDDGAMGRRARRRVVARYTWGSTLARLDAVLAGDIARRQNVA